MVRLVFFLALPTLSLSSSSSESSASSTRLLLLGEGGGVVEEELEAWGAGSETPRGPIAEEDADWTAGGGTSSADVMGKDFESTVDEGAALATEAASGSAGLEDSDAVALGARAMRMGSSSGTTDAINSSASWILTTRRRFGILRPWPTDSGKQSSPSSSRSET